MVKQLITNKFDAFIKKTFHNREEIKKMLLNHDAKHRCIDNICEQVKKIEEQNIKLDDKRLSDVAESIAGLFCLTALQVKERAIRNNASNIQPTSHPLSI